MGAIYWVVQRFLFLILRIFFRDIDSFGGEKIPKKGPIIFVVAPQYVVDLFR